MSRFDVGMLVLAVVSFGMGCYHLGRASAWRDAIKLRERESKGP